MSITGALQIGRSGLVAGQAGIEAAGNNLANVSTRGYHRQRVELIPQGREQLVSGGFLGRGVVVQQIVRQIDQALEARIRSSVSDQSASLVRQEILEQIETLQNEFSDNDLSTHLSEFFNAFSALANNPQDLATRSLVVQQAQTLTTFAKGLRSDLLDLRTQVDGQIDTAVNTANDLLGRIQETNRLIAEVEGGGRAEAHDLRDQREILLTELSEYLDISVVEQPNGPLDVFVGSLPLVLNGKSRGLEVRRETVDGQLNISVNISADGSPLKPTSGKIAALTGSRQDDIIGAVDTLDQFTHQLIFEVNRLHSQGQGLDGYDELTSDFRVEDSALALNDPDTGLSFTPEHGSFQLHVTQTSTGQRNTSVIDIDLDGIGPGGDTTLDSLAASIDAVAGVTASVTADGRLNIQADGNDLTLTFSDDTSGVLASLGLNSFFTGTDATNAQVHQSIQDDPARIAAALGHVVGDNRNAQAIAALRDQPLDELSGRSITDFWGRHVEDYALRTSRAGNKIDSDSLVRETLQAQQQSISGVNVDEEAIDLLAFQRAYQGSARFISVVDELMQTLLSLV